MQVHEILHHFNLPMHVSTDPYEWAKYDEKRVMDTFFYNGLFACPELKAAKVSHVMVFVFNNCARTLLHELGHAAGYYSDNGFFHDLKITGRQVFSRKELAYEELVAECTANLLALELNFTVDYNTRHDEYAIRHLKTYTYDKHDEVIQCVLRDAYDRFQYVMSHWMVGDVKQSA